MPTAPTGRRLIAFSQAFGWPEEVASTDTVLLPATQLVGTMNANGNFITGLPTPVNPSDAATKQYTDGIAQGISAVAACNALSANNIASLSGAQTVDGVSLVAGNRVLLTAQTTASQNGVWIVQSGAWTRPTVSPDFLTGTHAAGRFTFIESGTLYAKEGWVCTAQPGSDVVDTNSLGFVQFSGLGEVTAAAGLTANMNTLSVLLATPSGLQFVNGALAALPQPYGSLFVNADGIGVQLANATLKTSTAGLQVLGVPSLFTVNGVAVDANVTAAGLNKLSDGNSSLADSLHSHQSVLSAQALSAVHTNGSVALSIGDPVYWSATADTLARGDAAAYSSSTIIGVASGAIAANASGAITKRGVVTGVTTGGTPGTPVFLNVGGGLTTVLPTASSASLTQIGFLKNATDLDVSIIPIGRRASA